MALNVLTEAQKGYESLTDRLNKMDQYINEYDPTNPKKFAEIFSGRPTGMNPASLVNNATELSTTFGRTRSDLASEKMSALDRLIKLQPESTTDTLSTKDRLSLELSAAEKGMEIYKKDDGTLGVKKAGESMGSEIDSEVKAIVSGQKQLTDVPKALQSKVANKLSELGYSKDEFASKKKVALGAVDLLEELYGRGNKTDIGTKKDLSKAGEGGVLERIGATVKNWTKSITDPKLKEDANIYTNQLKIALGVFSQAFGSGTPQEGEAQRLIESAPGITSTNREATEWFKSVKRLLETPEMKINREINTPKTEIVTAPDGTQIEIID